MALNESGFRDLASAYALNVRLAAFGSSCKGSLEFVCSMFSLLAGTGARKSKRLAAASRSLLKVGLERQAG